MRRDAVAGFTVAVVLIPQSFAYAGVAGMPRVSGLYAAALPPIAAAVFASSPYLQTGPVAITSLLTFGALSSMAAPGSEEYVGLGVALALLVGAVRIGIGLARLGVVAHLMSEPMLRGFIPAAAAVVASTQVPAALGVAPDGGILGAALSALAAPGQWDPEALALSAATLGLMVLGRRLHPLFPGVLIALVGAILLSQLMGYGGPAIGEIPSGLPELPAFPLGSIPELLLPAAVIALVGFAEATSIAKTFATQDRRSWNPDREFVGQGAANLASALSGGFPVGGSLSRSALNRMAGATTRVSGAFTGLTVLAFLPFAAVLEPLPTAVLATVVIAAVAKLIARLSLLARLWRISRPQSVIAGSTCVLTFALAPRVDLAVLIGIAMAITWHLVRELRVDLHASIDGTILEVRPRGVLWFGTAETLQERVISLLEQHPETTTVRLRLDGLGRVDVSGALVLRSLCEDVRSASIDLDVYGMPEQAARLSQRVGIETASDASGAKARDDCGHDASMSLPPQQRNHGPRTTEPRSRAPGGRP